MNIEELLKETLQRYPSGTKYRAMDNMGVDYTGKHGFGFSIREPRDLSEGIDVGYGYVYNYKHEKWAEIVSLPTTEKSEEYVLI